MRTDIYTKVVLTVIAVMLSVIALRPQTTAQAQGGFAGVEYTVDSFQHYASFFDSRTGDLWDYDQGDPKIVVHSKMTKLGAPLTRVK